MKKIALVVLVICVLLGVSVYTIENISPSTILNTYEKVVESCGRTQVSDDKDLIGKRTLKEDAYVGTYIANCANENGREVIFGGGSLKERKVKVHGTIKTESGKATLSVRIGENKNTVTTDDNGDFTILLDMDGGGNYVILDYEDFTGSINLYSDYEQI